MASTPYSQAIGPRSVETLSLACLKWSAEDEDLQQKVGGSVAADAGTVPAMQQDGPERPFQNEYWDNKVPGLYVDVVSGEPQVSSVDKLNSGTGWPSFTKPLEPANVVENIDRSHRMTRTGVRSKHGDGHLDHLSPDGPRDKGDLRWRMNSASFRFIHRNQLESEGYGRYLKFFTQES